MIPFFTLELTTPLHSLSCTNERRFDLSFFSCQTHSFKFHPPFSLPSKQYLLDTEYRPNPKDYNPTEVLYQISVEKGGVARPP